MLHHFCRVSCLGNAHSRFIITSISSSPNSFDAYALCPDPSFSGCAGVKLYDWLSGAAAVGDSSFVSREETLRRAPCLDRDKIVGSIEMWEGQINDSRLAVSVALSAAAAGAVTLNHCEVVRLVKDGAGKARLCRSGR